MDKIELVNIEEVEEKNNKIIKLSETYWRDYLEDLNYNKDINIMCNLCIKDQIKKYGKQAIPCSGLNRAESKVDKDMFNKLFSTLTEAELKEMDAIYDPYSYMECFLSPTKPGEKALEDRWHQKLISSCLHGDSLVSMEGGKTKKIKNLKVGDKVLSYNAKKGSLPINKVTNVWKQGVKAVYRIRLENDEYLDCTSDHLILSNFKILPLNHSFKDSSYKPTYKSLKDGLDIGMDVYTVNSFVIDNKWTDKTCYNKLERVKIVSIDYIGEHETYDIEVANQHNFVANNIVVHNCSAKNKVLRLGRRAGKTFTMAMTMIHVMQVNEKNRVLLVSPYAVQTDEVIRTFKDLCSRLPENPIKSSKQSPVHEIIFHNGSILMGFTAASNADSLRGQDADDIFLDECLVGETLILMGDGEEKPIKDIKKGDFVLSIVEGKLSKEYVSNHKLTGYKEVFKYTFEGGYELTCTPNHPVFTSENESEVEIQYAKDIRVALIKDKYVSLIKVEYQGIEPVFNMTINKSHNYIANGMLTHNCDDIPEAAIVSIMGIRLSSPEVRTWKSGTPKGELNLYKAEQDPQSKCFYFPSYVIPHYNDEIDAALRHEVGEGVGYIQEIMALTGVASNSVFQSIFIQRALNKDIQINAQNVLNDRARFIVFIGVDWNHDKVGSRILVIAYDKVTPQFYIIDKEKVDIEGYTQYAAVEKIIQLNRIYNCDHIFCDQGFGAAQIADLKMFGMSQVGTVKKGHPDLKLVDVTPVDYGSSTTIRDPVSGEEYKSPTKQLAVQITVEAFEKNYVTLNKEEDKDIVNQLKNYVEKTRTAGRIVYGYISKKIGDHDLDAFMIGLFGMKRMYSTLFMGESSQALIKFVNKDEKVDESFEVLGPRFSRKLSKGALEFKSHSYDKYKRKFNTLKGRANI